MTIVKHSIDAAAAEKAVAAIARKADEMKLKMCIAVADEGGDLKAFLRMDGAPKLSIQISQDKAYTAAGIPCRPTPGSNSSRTIRRSCTASPTRRGCRLRRRISDHAERRDGRRDRRQRRPLLADMECARAALEAIGADYRSGRLQAPASDPRRCGALDRRVALNSSMTALSIVAAIPPLNAPRLRPPPPHARRALSGHRRRVVAGEESIDHRRHEEREERADRHAGEDREADVEARARRRRRRRGSAAPCRRPSPPSSSGSGAAAPRPPPRSPCAASSRRVSCSRLAKSTIRMPCFEIRPIRVTRPICE